MVFALNTVVGFACSIGLNMGFNTTHHHSETSEQISVNCKHSSHCTSGNQLSTGVKVHLTEKKSPQKDDCCTPNAIKFQQVDKDLRHASLSALKLPVFFAFLSAFFVLQNTQANFLNEHSSLTSQFYPPPDIRIAIQSFQI